MVEEHGREVGTGGQGKKGGMVEEQGREGEVEGQGGRNGGTARGDGRRAGKGSKGSREKVRGVITSQ